MREFVLVSQRKIIQPIDIYFYGKTALQNDKFLQLFMKNYNTMTNISTFFTFDQVMKICNYTN